MSNAAELVVQGSGGGIDAGLQSDNLEPQNEPASTPPTPADRAAILASPKGVAAVDSQTQRPHIPLGTKVVAGPIAEGAYVMSPTFNVGVLEGIDGWKDHAAHVPGATSALGAAQTALANTDEAYAVLQKDTGKTPEQKLAVLAASAAKVHDNVYAAIGASIQNIHKGLDLLEAGLSQPFEAKGVSTASNEIRLALRAMPLKERNEVVIKALADLDEPILAAVLGIHPIASGVDPARHKIWQRQVAEKRAPETVKRMQVMRRAAETLGRAQVALTQEFERAMRGSFAKGKVVEAHSNDSAVALAKLRGERLL